MCRQSLQSPLTKANLKEFERLEMDSGCRLRWCQLTVPSVFLPETDRQRHILMKLSSRFWEDVGRFLRGNIPQQHGSYFLQHRY